MQGVNYKNKPPNKNNSNDSPLKKMNTSDQQKKTYRIICRTTE